VTLIFSIVPEDTTLKYYNESYMLLASVLHSNLSYNYRKAKKPTIDLYDGTTNPKEHPRVCKAQMYVQDVDDATCWRYFPATLKGVA